MRSMFWGISALLAILPMIRPASAGDAKDEIARLSNGYNAAIKARDVKALGELLDDDGRFITGDGRVLDKKGYIADYVNETAYESITSDEVTVRLLGDVAIEVGAWTATGTRDGQPLTRHRRYTTIWLKRGDKWVVTAEQRTPIPSGR